MGKQPDTFVTTAGDRAVKVHVGKSRSGGNLNMGKWGFEVVDKASEQFSMIADEFLLDFQGNSCEPPPFSLEALNAMYSGGGVHHSCVDAKVSDVVGQGFDIRPRSELSPRAGDGPKELSPKGEDQQKVYDFLEIPTEEDGTAFLSVLEGMYRDVEAIGQGYIEFTRYNVSEGEEKRAGEVSGMYHAPSVSIRVAKGGVKNGFFQRAHGRYKYFARYDGVQKAKFVRVDGKQVAKANLAAGTESTGIVGVNPELITGRVGLFGKATPRDLNGLRDGSSAEVPVSELLMFKHGTTNSTSYGQSDILAARDDFAVEQAVREYGLSYFENGTIPRVVMSITGDKVIAAEVIKQIEDFLSNNEPIAVLQQSMLVELPEGVTLQIDTLTQAQLSDNTGLLDLRDHSAKYQAAAHRVPLSAIPMQTGSNRSEVVEDNARYVGSVVRPAQRKIEYRLNWVVRNETGVDTWVFDLDVPDLLDMKTKTAIWAVGAMRGWLTINEIRGYLNLKPVDGGDFPFVLVPGQGTVPISKLGEIADKMIKGAPRGELMGTGDTKTPPKGEAMKAAADTILAELAGEDKMLALALQPYANEMPDMPEEEREMVTKAAEELVVNADDVHKHVSPDDA